MNDLAPQEDSSEQQPEVNDTGPRSGLRNPSAAVRGVAVATLCLEVLVLLLALRPVRQFSTAPDLALAVLIGLAVACVVVCGLLRQRWGWYAGTAIQFIIIAAGVLHWSLLIVGALFLGIWLYVLRLRYVILGEFSAPDQKVSDQGGQTQKSSVEDEGSPGADDVTEQK